MKIKNFKQYNVKRFFMSVAGVIITAVNIGFFKLAAFGVDPFQSLVSGVQNLSAVSFGTLYVLLNAVLLAVVFVCDRHYIGLATLINLFFLGYITQGTLSLLQALLPTPSMPVRIMFFLVGFVGLCFGSSLYMTADLGVSTYDAMALIVSETWKVGHFKYVRMTCDFLCVLIGLLCSLLSDHGWREIFSFIGIGTILTAFFMGPLIDFFNRKCAVPFLSAEASNSAAK